MTTSTSASGAYFTFLMKKDGAYIRKCFDGDPSKLKYQYEWLLKHQGLSCIPTVENPILKWNYFSYDLRYYNDFRTFFEIIKSGDVFRCKKILDHILKILHLIHENGKNTQSVEKTNLYIENKIFKKIEYCEKLFPILKQFNKHDWVIINGQEVMNISLLRQRLLEQSTIEKISQYKESEIHGDLTIENILVSPKDDILFLDPNNENYISSPLIDYAKLLQSLHSKYELLCLVDKVHTRNNKIDFHMEHNIVYDHLLQHLLLQLRQELFPSEREQLLFHEAVHFSRLLPYQLRLNEHSFMGFYGTMLLRFNEYFGANLI